METVKPRPLGLTWVPILVLFGCDAPDGAISVRSDQRDDAEDVFVEEYVRTTPLSPTRHDPPTERDPGASGPTSEPGSTSIDFSEPPPALDATWSDEALRSRSTGSLTYTIVNRSDAEMTLVPTLVWDGGTTTGHKKQLSTVVVAAGDRVSARVDARDIPAGARGKSYPGLLQLSLHSASGHTTVLPAFYTLPRSQHAFPAAVDWDYELMTPAELEAATERALRRDDDTNGVPVRVVEWEPSRSAPTDADGAAE